MFALKKIEPRSIKRIKIPVYPVNGKILLSCASFVLIGITHCVSMSTHTELQNELAQCQTDLERNSAESRQRNMEAQARVVEFQKLIGSFKALIDSGKLQIRMVDGRMVVVLASDVLFPSGSAALSAEGQSAVAEVAAIMARMPDKRFQVEGHTDNVPITSRTLLYRFPSNWQLASERAITVLKVMIEGGVKADHISAASFGENKPVRDNASEDGRRANRRIEIVIVPDLSSLPGFEELKKIEAGG